MKSHPYADLFPMMTYGEHCDLRQSMNDRGYDPLFPVITYQGMILDGRNRWKCADIVGVKAVTRAFEGTDEQALAFVVSANLHRRHLSTSQRASIAAELANLLHGQKKADVQSCTSRADAADRMQVSKRSVDMAASVKRDAPELHEKVKQGEMTVSRAHAEVKAKQAPPRPPSPTVTVNLTSGRKVTLTIAEAREMLALLPKLIP
jgi:hypothetical protein